MKITFSALAILGCAFTSQAEQLKQEPPKNILKIEDFLPEKKHWSLSYGASILNSSGDGNYPAVHITHVGPGQYIVDRTTRSYEKESNGVSGYFSVMYGITDRVSLTTSLNGQWLNTRYYSNDNTHSKKDAFEFNGLGVGLSYQLYSLSDFTVLYGGGNINYGAVQSVILGASLNWIYDPLVLNLSLGYLDGISKEKFSNDYVAYVTTAKVIFAINPEINLNWGFSKDFTNSYSQYGNKKRWRGMTSMLAGTSINILEDLTGSINVKGGVGNNKNSVISLGLNYKM